MGEFGFFFLSVKFFKIVQFFSHFCSCAFLQIFANLEFILIHFYHVQSTSSPILKSLMYWGHLVQGSGLIPTVVDLKSDKSPNYFIWCQRNTTSSVLPCPIFLVEPDKYIYCDVYIWNTVSYSSYWLLNPLEAASFVLAIEIRNGGGLRQDSFHFVVSLNGLVAASKTASPALCAGKGVV